MDPDLSELPQYEAPICHAALGHACMCHVTLNSIRHRSWSQSK